MLRLGFKLYGFSIMAGADDVEVPPVPIPNTEVKLDRTEDTWLETTWENRQVPALFFSPNGDYVRGKK